MTDSQKEKPQLGAVTEDKPKKSNLPDVKPAKKPISFYLKRPLAIERKKEPLPAGTKIGEIHPIGCLSALQLCDLVRSGRASLTPPEPEEED